MASSLRGAWPFVVVGLVAGAIRIRFLPYIFGTAFGMLPGTLAATVFGDQLEVALRDPRELNYVLVAVCATLLVGGALIAPQDGGTDYLIVGVQEDRTVHLPGQPDAGNLRRIDLRVGEHAPHAFHRGLPPVRRFLLRPQRVRGGQGIFFRRAGHFAARHVHQQRFGAAGTDVYTE